MCCLPVYATSRKHLTLYVGVYVCVCCVGMCLPLFICLFVVCVCVCVRCISFIIYVYIFIYVRNACTYHLSAAINEILRIVVSVFAYSVAFPFFLSFLPCKFHAFRRSPLENFLRCRNAIPIYFCQFVLISLRTRQQIEGSRNRDSIQQP